MSVLLSQLAEMVEGNLVGDGQVEIVEAATLRDARVGAITFVDNPRLDQQLRQCEAAAVVVPRTFQPEHIPYITVEDVLPRTRSMFRRG